jgi:hypothetical protein
LIKRLSPDSTSRHRALRQFPDKRGVCHASRDPRARARGPRGGASSQRSARAPDPYFLRTEAAGDARDPQDVQDGQVREWLFLLLRFAITRHPDDELSVLMMANGIDSLGRQWGRAAPTFFRRSSDEVCKSIRALDDPGREAILKKHIRRIEHPGMRRAFQAAVDCERRSTAGF